MKYLKRVTLKNFQSHKHSVLEFNQGLNIIVGPSDSGKSAIIRAIKWALYNEPSGDYFIREGEKETSVILEFSNNIKIKRLRNKSKNAYMILDNDGHEIVFEGFGNKVPQEIVDLIGIEKVPLDTNESNAINLGEQLEGAFLLSEKSSTRASAIGRLVGVNLIDDALKDTLKDIRNISIEKKTISDSIKNIEEELITYEYLDSLKENILDLEKNRNNIKNKTNLKNNLMSTSEQLRNINFEKNNTNNTLIALKNITLLEEYVYKSELKMKELNVYNNLNGRFNQNAKQLFNNKELLDKLINNDFIERLVKKIDKCITKAKTLKNIQSKLTNYRKEINETSLNIEKLNRVDFVQSNIKSLSSGIQRLIKLQEIDKNTKSLYRSMDIGNQYLKKLENLNEIDIISENLNKLTSKINKVSAFSERLRKTRIEINQVTKSLQGYKASIDDNLEKYEELLKQNEICPFCLSVINEDKIDHIVKHYS